MDARQLLLKSDVIVRPRMNVNTPQPSNGSIPPPNRLLSALPSRDRAALAPHLERVQLKVFDFLARKGERFTHAFFPETSMISLVTRMQDGRSVEVGTVGNEGMAGLSALLDEDASDCDTFCQIAGYGTRIPMPVLLDAYRRREGVRRYLNRYAQAYVAQVGQTAACNRLHGIEQRCARWLLMAQDRALVGTFALKHQFLAEMLGVSRVSVTSTAGVLQDDGMIRYRRGVVRIINREALEAVACECYALVRDRFDHVLS
jgi:CRP-like cAMP-binding protein